MNAKDTATMMRDLDVAASIFESLEHMLENNVGISDLHFLACLAAEGKRKLFGVVNSLSS